jgi:hypothetical protein
MPLFNYLCTHCNSLGRVILDKEPKEFVCKICNYSASRVFEGPTTQVKEIKDNGFMPKRIEQIQDMEKLIQDRNNETKKS